MVDGVYQFNTRCTHIPPIGKRVNEDVPFLYCLDKRLRFSTINRDGMESRDSPGTPTYRGEKDWRGGGEGQTEVGEVVRAPRLPTPVIMHIQRTNQRERSRGSDKCSGGVSV